MKTFFSIIYIPLSSNLQEKISIGLVMSDGEQNIFKISKPKFQIVKNLFSTHKYNLLKNYFNNIIEEITPNINAFRLDLNPYSSNNWLNESYISYLNRYSNNLVVYSEPRKIDIAISTENFNRLFKKFVFEYDEEVNSVAKENILSKVNKQLYSKIESHVNLQVTVNSSNFNELLTPVDVNFIGKNGVIVAGQAIDFDKRLYNLEHDLTSYISFTKAVDYSGNNGKYFLVGQEPDKKENPNNHRTWKQVKESHLVDYIDLNETDKIKEYIISNGVAPYFEKEMISD